MKSSKSYGKVNLKPLEQTEYVWAESQGKEGLLPRSWLTSGELGTLGWARLN